MQLNLTAPINQLGYGIVGLNALLALQKLGHDVSLWPIHKAEPTPEHSDAVRLAEARCGYYDPKAPSIRIWQQFNLAQHVGKGVHASVSYFERDLLYEHEANHFKNQDIVIASSTWMGEVLVANGIDRTKIRYARPGVDHSVFKPAPAAQSRETRFLCVGKWEVRKGHDKVVEAFNKAFQPGDDVRLVMLTANPFLTAEQSAVWEKFYQNSRMGKQIHVIRNRLDTQAQVAQMMADSDCGVFISRAEGWNLDLAEMLAMGKQVIATAFSAHTEFCDDTNSYLVQIDSLEDAYDGKWFFGHGQWASLGDSQIDQTVEHMRSVHRTKQESGMLSPNQRGIDSMSRFTWENFGRELVAAVTQGGCDEDKGVVGLVPGVAEAS